MAPRLGSTFQPTFSMFPARPSARCYGNRAEDSCECGSDSTLSSQRANTDSPDDHLLRGPIGPGGRARPVVTSSSHLDGCRDNKGRTRWGRRQVCFRNPAAARVRGLEALNSRVVLHKDLDVRSAVGGDLRSFLVFLAGGRSRGNVSRFPG